MSRVLSLAGFQVTLIGRFWVTTEDQRQKRQSQRPHRESRLRRTHRQQESLQGFGGEKHNAQKGRLPGSAALEETPHRTGFEKGFNAKRGTPVKIARSILSIAEASANRNDSLMLIVSERNKT